MSRDLLDEEGIGGELEVLLPVGLEMERGPEALDRGLRDPGAAAMKRQVQCVRPSGGRVSSVFWISVMTVSSGMEARSSRPVFVVEAHEALGAEAFAPAADCLATDAEPRGHRRVVQALGAQQHDPGAAHQARGQAARPGQRARFPHAYPAHVALPFTAPPPWPVTHCAPMHSRSCSVCCNRIRRCAWARTRISAASCTEILVAGPAAPLRTLEQPLSPLPALVPGRGLRTTGGSACTGNGRNRAGRTWTPLTALQTRSPPELGVTKAA